MSRRNDTDFRLVGKMGTNRYFAVYNAPYFRGEESKTMTVITYFIYNYNMTLVKRTDLHKN